VRKTWELVMATQKKNKKADKGIVNKAGMLQAPVKGTPVQLPEQFESKFITTDLISEIRKTTEEIQSLLMTKSRVDVRIAEALATLKSQFTAYAHQKKISTKDAEQAFGEFVQVAFDIGETRANEYIRVTKKKELEGMKLPISNLVELSRLPDEALGEFLEEYPAEELSKLSFRKMQTLVRDNNENSRPKVSSSGGGGGRSVSHSTDTDNTPSALAPVLPQGNPERELAVLMDDDSGDTTEIIGAVIESPTVSTARLRSAFESFKQAFESEQLTQDAETLLTEIKEWHSHLAKKAKGV
jgi:hypothetical protein